MPIELEWHGDRPDEAKVRLDNGNLYVVRRSGAVVLYGPDGSVAAEGCVSPGMAANVLDGRRSAVEAWLDRVGVEGRSISERGESQPPTTG